MDVEQNRSFFNSMAEQWDTLINHNPHKIRFFLELSGIKNGDSVLDVGTGTGVLLPSLLELTGNNGRITAIDLAENMIKKARAKWSPSPVEFICGDIADYPLPVAYYDAVFCYSVFPHFVDPTRVLAKLASHLKPGGRLLVCHSESRDAINARHRELGRKLISHGLLPSEQVAVMFGQAGLHVVDQADTDELYYVLGRKGLRRKTPRST